MVGAHFGALVNEGPAHYGSGSVGQASGELKVMGRSEAGRVS